MSTSCNCNTSVTALSLLIGGKYKFAVNITCDGFDMDDDDWTITITRGDTSVAFTPENAIREVENEGLENETSQWYICLDTEGFKPGDSYITFEAEIPDEAFPNDVRKEIEEKYFYNFILPKKA